ncbi:hypothetical protein JCM17846_09570 [Iodidimonas nitroreducens]|uniref:Response regulatory domain-containing protein n=1 Tax=Iodidimonas nitroreducens TaxID=1236968 RepID=A0A5A7N6K6_9PROT|nr:response regulator [Iodidimonas nitroreducens]GAK33840.1 putative transcriptional regulatory protein TcrX [alpha proteobacterium Q-1]GER03275.1 hypothetical protein JCM17846_09570 [Iodidimonas nitroreducens]
MTILLIDDDPAIGRLYGAAIQKRGFNVKLCTAGDQALEFLHRQKPHLIVSDVEMPGLSGHDVALRLLQRGPRPCPILFLSANDTVESVLQGLRCGGDDFLIKGEALNHMIDRMAFWLTSGFRALPLVARHAAMDMLETMNPIAPLLPQIKKDRALVDMAFESLYRDVQSTPPGYGVRLIERIEVMGRTAELIERQCTEPAHWLRFPDAVLSVIHKLRTPWALDIGVLCRHYELLSRDPRFQKARTMLRADH